MRIKVRKFLFYGSDQDRAEFFRRSQQAGCIEFIESTKAHGERPFEIGQLQEAIKVLRGQNPTDQEALHHLSMADEIAQKIVHLHEKHQRLEEERRLVRQDIARVQIFGDFSMKDIRFIEHKGRFVQFYCQRHGARHDEEDLIYVGSDHNLDYYVGIHTEKRQYPGLTEMRIDKPLGELKHRLHEIVRELHAIDEDLQEYAKRKTFLEQALAHRINEFSLSHATEHVQKPLSSLFAVQGWIPENRIPDLPQLTRGLSVEWDEIEIEKGDFVPTWLENRKLARVGEDLVHIYDTPSNHDRDPSRWVLWFFAFFFAVILNDAGYGLILLATSLFLGWKFGPKGGLAKRFTRLCVILSSFTIIWGVLTTSYFGIQLAPDNPIRKVSFTSYLVTEKADYMIAHPDSELYKEWVTKYPQLSTATTANAWLNGAVKEQEGTKVYDLLNAFTDNILLELALFIGALHLCISFLRVIDRHWAGIGWILFIIGGYLYFPSILKATSILHFALGVDPTAAAHAGLELIYVGIGTAVLLAFIQHKLSGAGELMNLIQVFADVLSYLRLYALGLAGAMMSKTFNDLGIGAGPVFGTLIIILGHSVNISLSIIAGIIHGLRLNFLEWYRHCFDGGGKMLAPLHMITKGD